MGIAIHLARAVVPIVRVILGEEAPLEAQLAKWSRLEWREVENPDTGEYEWVAMSEKAWRERETSDDD